MPQVPVSVWEQIAVVIVFAFLLAGLGWILVKVFAKAIADINSHYALLIEHNNNQWQKYFDARSEASQIVNQQIIGQLEGLTAVVKELAKDFAEHDTLERQMLAELSELTEKRKPAKKNPNQ